MFKVMESTLHKTTIEYKHSPQGTLVLDIYSRKPEAQQRRPAILYLFGGGWLSGHREQFQTQAEYFADQGMVSILVDYRVFSRHQTTPLDALDDAQDAFDWVSHHATKLSIDPNKIIIAGGSSGGHLALCSALNCNGRGLSTKPVALILYNPVTDLRAASPELGFSEGELALLANMTREEIHQFSPATQPCKKLPPTLIIYGMEDPLLAQAEQGLCAKTSEHTPAMQIMRWPGVGHGFFNKEPWLHETTKATEQFLLKLQVLPTSTDTSTLPRSSNK
ncbi:alpha/beta hydrolase [Parahaliea sp. F7430]|uniref:Alpha/beta hydrolase n=1 Tax=Sediminihaliea albiluteola TaxID=2758564 RepID=A0A7W2YJ33_9GAMM|nr:alpha/beta hydrolase [Sediminihaliea albiluteola]MBA6412687.1 alpha/beta hydrolase [Sediminihaliea albiluteola]